MTAEPSAVERALREVLVPESDYRVVPVPGRPGYRIGRSSDGGVVLLTPPDPAPKADTRLERLGLMPSIACRVTDDDGRVEQLTAGVVAYRPGDDDLVPHFVRVAEALADLLGPDPAPGEVSREMARLVRLFEPTRGPRGSELGLWGELLTIASSADPAQMLAAWHVRVDDRFDFAAEGSRLEVKTTAGADRVHRFRLHQLEPVPGAATYVVSVTTSTADGGTTVADLVDRIGALLTGRPAAVLVLHAQVAATLGPEWTARPQTSYDEAQAVASTRLLDAAAVPRVGPAPPAVLSVELTVDCSDVPTISPVDASGLGRLVTAATGLA